HRDGRPVKVTAETRTSELEQRRGEVDVSRHGRLHGASGNAWAPDEKGHANVLVEATLLAGGQPVLAKVEPVVGAVHDVRVVEEPGRVQLVDDLLHDLVDSLQSLEASAVVVVQVRDGRLVEL